MKTILAAYAAAAVTMLGMDAVWLSVSADLLYRPLLGDILLPGFRPVPAILFYVIYVAGIVIFAIKPALVTGRWSRAAGKGALLGVLIGVGGTIAATEGKDVHLAPGTVLRVRMDTPPEVRTTSR